MVRCVINVMHWLLLRQFKEHPLKESLQQRKGILSDREKRIVCAQDRTKGEGEYMYREGDDVEGELNQERLISCLRLEL